MPGSGIDTDSADVITIPAGFDFDNGCIDDDLNVFGRPEFASDLRRQVSLRGKPKVMRDKHRRAVFIGCDRLVFIELTKAEQHLCARVERFEFFKAKRPAAIRDPRALLKIGLGHAATLPGPPLRRTTKPAPTGYGKRTTLQRAGVTAAKFALVGLINAGAVRPLVSQTYPLAEIHRAQEDFAAKTYAGKLVLISRLGASNVDSATPPAV